MIALIPQNNMLNECDPCISNNDLTAEQNMHKEFVHSNSLQANLSKQKRHGKHHSRHIHHKSDTNADECQIMTEYIKIENKKSSLKREAKLYKMLSGSTGFPMYLHFITKGEKGQLFLEALGSNLMSLVKGSIKMDMNNKVHLSLKTVLQIADQALLRLQYFHKRGYIHGDITPENLYIGNSQKSNQIYLTNLGFATRYINKKSGEHLPFSDKHNYQGSLIFSSINSQRGFNLSRRDDLESLGYVLVFLLHGSLPWSSYTSNKSILFSKMNTPVKYLCEGLPSEFEQFINSARCLTYSDDPDYSYYRRLFRDLFISKGYIYDYVYDWSINDNFKTIISVSSSFSQTNSHHMINSLEIQQNKNIEPHSKSNGLFCNAFCNHSAHQTADIAMLNCNRHSRHKNNKPDKKKLIFKENIQSSLGKDIDAQYKNQQKACVSNGPLAITSGNKSRLIMDFRGMPKKALRNQSSG